MHKLAYLVTAAALGVVAPALAAASPLQVASAVLVEHRTAATDGSVRVSLAPAKHVVPGDRVVFALNYRNAGNQPLTNIVFDNPVPAQIGYRGAADGSAEPLLSVDGKTFAPLAALRVAGRPATVADVTHVRWRLATPIAAGAQGRVAFNAVVK